ncbi:hypothetical protein DiNV_CH01M_ORF103 [Drosophila innubila nudivirus]|uniref:Uncharacterized protein n=1 Tax=Drosophila innubila nudivirus TaxID=2057187 RepID=A0A2H4UX91_9VIRU|nr:hypothetical protein DiNV_CH01M_ORF103 [Drosophila innubila nudivirus]ATZ81528.1 hypothetical protein DiNV_CH01M_ORF103 [Drosophila innubila nudivirus]
MCSIGINPYILGWGAYFFVEKYKHFSMSHMYIFGIVIIVTKKYIHFFTRASICMYVCVFTVNKQLPPYYIRLVYEYCLFDMHLEVKKLSFSFNILFS